MSEHKPFILAIDDAPANLLTLGAALASEFSLQIATSGAMGLALARAAPPDLILQDVMMPEMDGFEACRRFKADPRLKSIPVVFVSADDHINSQAQGLALGAADYITKPIHVDIARQRIRNLLEREQWRKDLQVQRDLLQARVVELDQTQLRLRASEATLRQSEAFKLATLNSLPESIVVVNHDGVIQAANEPWRGFALANAKAAGQAGLCADVGAHYPSICATAAGLGADAVRQTAQGIQDVLAASRERFSLEYASQAPGERWYCVTISPLGQASPGALVVIAHTDITLRKHNEAQLERLVREQKAMLENDMVGIVKVKDRTILWANPAFEKMLGYDSGELAGRSTRSNYPSERAYRELGEAAYHALASSNIFRTQIEHLRKDGKLIWVDLTGAMLNQEAGESLWAFLDITERKRAEDALKLQLRFTQALNDIASATSDLNDPDAILAHTAEIVGRAMGVDRSLIYDVSFELQQTRALCEWLNPEVKDLQSTKGTYPLSMFSGSFRELLRTHAPLISQADAVNPHFVDDASGEVLHQRMGIKSLLWYPFAFHDQSFHLLVLNQVHAWRNWSREELDFLDAVSRQVSVALVKIQLLNERRQADERLQLAASVFTHSREGITIAGPDGSIIDVNDAFTRITGYSRDEVIGKNPRILSSGRQSKEFYAEMWGSLKDKGHWYGEIWNRRKNSEVYAEMLTISAVRDAQGKTLQYLALFSDITTAKEHQKKLEHIAHYDALTTLPNRVLLADRLHQAMTQAVRRGQRLAVAFLDLDSFKEVNDRHGHEAGDQLLVTVAERMKLTLREGDSLARMGGDEFVAVLLDLPDVVASAPMLTRLLAAAAQPVLFAGLELQVSASLGITFYPQSQDVDADQLLRQADQAMYQSKLAGKNRYHVFDAEQDSSIRGHHESLLHIRQALDRDEFVLHYQPKVNMRTGQVVGAEALIRWQHPQRGLLAPAVFLHVIEDHVLAVELGEWVIASALRQMAAWREAGLHLPVSVNVGARQLQQGNFVERLREILAANASVDPCDLELEVLETSALEDVTRVSQIMQSCRAMGVRFSLDDFGTGYSSLTYLKRLPVALLKIDQSFVRDMLEDPEDLAILEGIIGLAVAFGRQTIAEGVETVEQGTKLLQLGCELAQGYRIARAMAADELPAWAAAWTTHRAWADAIPMARSDPPLG